MTEVGWVNLPQTNGYEIQENVFSGNFRYRVYRPDRMFHPWFLGKPPEKEST